MWPNMDPQPTALPGSDMPASRTQLLMHSLSLLFQGLIDWLTGKRVLKHQEDLSHWQECQCCSHYLCCGHWLMSRKSLPMARSVVSWHVASWQKPLLVMSQRANDTQKAADFEEAVCWNLHMISWDVKGEGPYCLHNAALHL